MTLDLKEGSSTKIVDLQLSVQKLEFDARLVNRFITPFRAVISGPSQSGNN